MLPTLFSSYIHFFPNIGRCNEQILSYYAYYQYVPKSFKVRNNLFLSRKHFVSKRETKCFRCGTFAETISLTFLSCPQNQISNGTFSHIIIEKV